jgi:L-ascorbate metabolism protein UlaG (beta-lactamase superfamily)
VGDRITFAGHSTVRMELGGTTLLTDPLLRRRFLHAYRHAAPPPPGVLDGLDAVLVSHLHMDHLDFPSIRGLDRETEMVVPHRGARVVRRRGFRRVTEMGPGDAVTIGAVEVVATIAVHDGRRYPFGPAVQALGFDLRAPGSRVYFAGDTDVFDGMADLGPNVDVALLPVGGWGPRVGEGHLDAERAAEAAALIRPRIVVPIHWGTYLRAGLAGTRPGLLTEPPRELLAAVRRVAPDVKVKVLEPGASLELGHSRSAPPP